VLILIDYIVAVVRHTGDLDLGIPAGGDNVVGDGDDHGFLLDHQSRGGRGNLIVVQGGGQTIAAHIRTDAGDNSLNILIPRLQTVQQDLYLGLVTVNLIQSLPRAGDGLFGDGEVVGLGFGSTVTPGVVVRILECHGDGVFSRILLHVVVDGVE